LGYLSFEICQAHPGFFKAFYSIDFFGRSGGFTDIIMSSPGFLLAFRGHSDNLFSYRFLFFIEKHLSWVSLFSGFTFFIFPASLIIWTRIVVGDDKFIDKKKRLSQKSLLIVHHKDTETQRLENQL
jgi:hypothetical protein